MPLRLTTWMYRTPCKETFGPEGKDAGKVSAYRDDGVVNLEVDTNAKEK